MRAAIFTTALVGLTSCSNKRPAPPDAAMDAQTCSAGWVRCGGECVDLRTNPDHCGHCDCTCRDAEDCSKGVCERVGFGCGEPKKVCGGGALLPPEGACAPRRERGGCVDVNSDNNNCGDCRVTCDLTKGFTCVEAKCTCARDLTECDGACINTRIDAKHCGQCGNVCAATETCLAGLCMHDDCSPPKMCCAGSVVDPQSDNNNCGACGNKCDTAKGYTCKSGKCECAVGTDCDGQCVDTQTDDNHCGGCGQKCGDSDPPCKNGVCAWCPLAFCPPDLCVDIQIHPDHCGGCNIKCPSGVCASGQCQGDAGVFPNDGGVDAAEGGG